MDYEKLYHILFNAVTDAVQCIDEGNERQARLLLVLAQQEAERIYIEAADKPQP